MCALNGAPRLFAYTDAVSRLLTGAVFYWLVPRVLMVITWKAAGRPDLPLIRILIYITGCVTCALLFLRIRPCPDAQRRWRNPPRWAMLGVAVALLGLATLQPEAFQRLLNLYRVDLKEAWLPGVDLSEADMRFAILQGARLFSATLQPARLLFADLQGADLRGTNLRGVKNLTAGQVASARTDEKTRLPDYLPSAQPAKPKGPLARPENGAPDKERSRCARAASAPSAPTTNRCGCASTSNQ